MNSYASSRISNPTDYFAKPDDVLNDGKLSHDEKQKILRSMADQAKQAIEGSAAGTVGPEPLYTLDDLQTALEKLHKIKSLTKEGAPMSQKSRFQRILVVATGNQDLNREIATVAYDLAEISGGRVSLLSVVPPIHETVGMAAAAPMVSVAPVTSDTSRIIKDREAQLTQLQTECGAGFETDTEVVYDLIEDMIADYAKDHNADIIVVGAPNRSWLEALFKPSTALSITKAAICPVLVVPELAQ